LKQKKLGYKKSGFQNAEEYKTFLKKEATRIAETTMI
jgi:hypothetical protein